MTSLPVLISFLVVAGASIDASSAGPIKWLYEDGACVGGQNISTKKIIATAASVTVEGQDEPLFYVQRHVGRFFSGVLQPTEIFEFPRTPIPGSDKFLRRKSARTVAVYFADGTSYGEKADVDRIRLDLIKVAAHSSRFLRLYQDSYRSDGKATFSKMLLEKDPPWSQSTDCKLFHNALRSVLFDSRRQLRRDTDHLFVLLQHSVQNFLDASGRAGY